MFLFVGCTGTTHNKLLYLASFLAGPTLKIAKKDERTKNFARFQNHFPLLTMVFSPNQRTRKGTSSSLLFYTEKKKKKKLNITWLTMIQKKTQAEIGHVRYINILTWLRGFQVKLLYLVLFSLYPSLFWELRNKRSLKNVQFLPESLGAM